MDRLKYKDENSLNLQAMRAAKIKYKHNNDIVYRADKKQSVFEKILRQQMFYKKDEAKSKKS